MEPRVADGGWTHVDATTARTEIEGGADDGDLLACSHDAKPYSVRRVTIRGSGLPPREDP